jgi:hypothetical protein
MTTPCIFCVEKHVARAHGYFEEALAGYGGRVAMAIGELSLAEDEAREAYPELAQVLRTHRKQLEVGRTGYKLPFEELLENIEGLVRHADPAERKVSTVDPDDLRSRHDYAEIPLWGHRSPTNPQDAPHAPPTPTPPRTGVATSIVDGKDMALEPSQNPPISGPPDRTLRGISPAQSGPIKNASTVMLDGKPAPAPRRAPPRVSLTKGCSGCEISKELAASGISTRIRQENLDDHAAGLAPRRVVILTTLGDFTPAYSLVTCIIDQARALALAGCRVHLFVHKDCNMQDLPYLPETVEVRPVLPRLALRENVVDEQGATDAASVLMAHLMGLGSAAVIAHDLVFQSWFVTYAKALHTIGDRYQDFTWYHVCHSSVGSVPPADPAIKALRATIPKGHRMIVLSKGDIPRFAAYYSASEDQFLHVPNIRDPRQLFGLSKWGDQVLTKSGLLNVTGPVQVYPLSAPRMAAKGLHHVIRLFARMERTWRKGLLLVVDAHANGEEGRRAKTAMKALATKEGLSEGILQFVSDLVPERAAAGLPATDVQGLMRLGNLFAFPTTSEAGSLVLQEAYWAGNLLVLNQSLPCLLEQARGEYLTHPWGSARQSVKDPSAGLDDLVGVIAATLKEVLETRQAATHHLSCEALGPYLRERIHIPPLPARSLLTNQEIAQRREVAQEKARRLLPAGAVVGQPVALHRRDPHE